MGIGYYEGMAWEHLPMHFDREKTHRMAIRMQQEVSWELLMQQQREGK